jgi:decaprenylphospho-beta-D-erythro-pentofuranosid-2-ulose 2-reductase
VRDALGRIQTLAVFGGNSDLGAAVANRLADDGLRRVALAVRDPRRARHRDALRRRGIEVHVTAFDADDTAGHPAAVDGVFAALGDVDCALIAFGVLGDQAALEADHAAAVAVARTNYVGAVSVLTLLARRLQAQGHGSIAVLSSVAGERVRRANYVYGSSKAGLDGFAQGLGDALAEDGIHVLVVRPGFVRTQMTDGRDAAPLATDAATVAEAVVAGLRRGAATVWAPPALRWAFVVMRHLPRFVWRRIGR